MGSWDDLLDEFRALGGTADNIRLGRGAFGRGLFPVDPAKPIAIRVPDNLLMATDDMVLINGVPHVRPGVEVGERERAWLDRYQADFAWGGGGVDEIRQTFEMAGALPAELREALLRKFRCGRWFEDPTEELILDQYFLTRRIYYKGRTVVMPLIEMANHGDGATYDTDDGVALRGSFPGEILVEYSASDSHGFFAMWGFAIERPLALSAPVETAVDSVPLLVRGNFARTLASEGSWTPHLDKDGEKLALPFLVIGHRRYPSLPKAVFYRLMRDAGYNGFAEAFDLIQHLNQMRFVNLLIAIDGIDLPIARRLRAMAHYQLRTMGFC